MSELLAWWHSEFTAEEQHCILTRYQPLVIDVAADETDVAATQSESPLYNIIRSDGSLCLELAALATWFISPKEDLPLARRILAKGVERGEGETGETLDRHFIYHDMIRVYYRDRIRDPNALGLAVEACQKQIALGPDAAKALLAEYPNQALPRHTGFEQLAIIREKEKDYVGAIRLSEEALAQGWNGDWKKRIARYMKRLPGR